MKFLGLFFVLCFFLLDAVHAEEQDPPQIPSRRRRPQHVSFSDFIVRKSPYPIGTKCIPKKQEDDELTKKKCDSQFCAQLFLNVCEVHPKAHKKSFLHHE